MTRHTSKLPANQRICPGNNGGKPAVAHGHHLHDDAIQNGNAVQV
jgi:hypothetical protein